MVHWRLITDSRVTSLAVTEHLDVFEHLVLGVLPGLVALVMRQFRLQGVEETLWRGMSQQQPLRLMLQMKPGSLMVFW